MARYNRNQIRSMINALALVYDIPASSWFLTYGTAMVVHGFSGRTDDIDVTLRNEDFDRLREFFDVDTDVLGPIIELPGKVEIRPMSTLRTQVKWCRMHGCVVASPESLKEAYEDLINNPVPGRDKLVSDTAHLEVLNNHLRVSILRSDSERNTVIKHVSHEVVNLVSDNRLQQLFDLLPPGPTVLHLTADNHAKWGVKIDQESQVVSVWDKSKIDDRGNADVYSIRLTHSFGRVSH